MMQFLILAKTNNKAYHYPSAKADGN